MSRLKETVGGGGMGEGEKGLGGILGADLEGSGERGLRKGLGGSDPSSGLGGDGGLRKGLGGSDPSSGLGGG